MKTYSLIPLIISGFIVYSCGVLESESEKSFTIMTDKRLYNVRNEFSAAVIFKNDLGKAVSLMYSGCNMPNFVLERFENGNWSVAGGPECIAIVISPKNLRDGKSYSAIVKMYVDEFLTPGTYRIIFDIRNEPYGKKIDLRYQYSNEFTIIRN